MTNRFANPLRATCMHTCACAVWIVWSQFDWQAFRSSGCLKDRRRTVAIMLGARESREFDDAYVLICDCGRLI